MSARRVALGLSLAAALTVTGLLLAPATRVWWYAGRLDSPSPEARSLARVRLLELGRPAIDGVLPDLVAGEVVDELSNTEAVAAVVRGHELEERLAGLEVPGPRLEFGGEPVCPTARLLRRQGARRELVVLGRREGRLELRVAVPLDDELGPAILAAVKKRLTSPGRVP